MVGYTDRYDSLIQYYVHKYFPSIKWLLIKAQIWKESSFNEKAVSPHGAKGLLQIMPGTAAEIGINPKDLFNPEVNIRGGIIYLKKQYNRFPEITQHKERLKFSLGAYNAGRGWINLALELAREEEGKTIKESGLWQTWNYTSKFLRNDACRMNVDADPALERPDADQIINYVKLILEQYRGFRL